MSGAHPQRSVLEAPLPRRTEVTGAVVDDFPQQLVEDRVGGVGFATIGGIGMSVGTFVGVTV